MADSTIHRLDRFRPIPKLSIGLLLSCMPVLLKNSQMIRVHFVFLAAFVVFFGSGQLRGDEPQDSIFQGASAVEVPQSCGIADIDRIRADSRITPTDSSNIQSRRAAAYRWWRLLWHQGFDMNAKGCDATWERVLSSDGDPSFKAVDAAFNALEDIMTRGELIPEIAGTPDDLTTKTQTDWPGYHGTDGSQTGYSPDAGPSRGRIAWRVPKGNFWYATPVVADGRVYTASPGADVIAYCLDENTGEVIWNGRQFGTQIYQTPGSIFSPVVTPDTVLITAGWWQPNSFHVLNRKTGKTVAKVSAGQIAGGNTKTLTAYKHNRWNVILADANSGKGVWQFYSGGNLSGEPVLSGKAVYAARQSGQVYRLGLDSPKPLWQQELKANLRGTPGVGRSCLFVGDTQRTLHAVDRSNGKTKWTFQAEVTESEPRAYQFFSTALEAEISSLPNPVRVYVGAASGYLYCLNATDGTLIWKRKLSDWIRSKPIVIGETIYVATLDAKLVALQDHGDSATELWTTTLGEHGFTADLTGTENGILASGMDLILYSVSPRTGTLKWRHSLIDGAWINGTRHQADVFAGQYQTSPVIVDGVVYIGGPDGFLNAHDAQTGEKLWRFEARGRISATPRVAEGKVFVGQNARYNEYYAVDQKTGQPVWQLDNLGWATVGSTAYNNGRIFVGSESGKFYGIDARKGVVLWKHESAIAGQGFQPPPATDDTLVFTGSHDGRYYALNQEDGSVAWSVDTSAKPGVKSGGNPDSAGIVLSGRYAYVQKRGARIAALERRTGKEVWQWKQPSNYLQNGAVATHNKKVFGSVVRGVTSIPYSARIYAFSDVDNGGQQLWSYDKAGGGGGLTAPVLTNDKLIFGSSAGVYVTCLDPESGQQNWRCYVGGPMEEGVPALYGNKVFTQHRNGYLFAIE